MDETRGRRSLQVGSLVVGGQSRLVGTLLADGPEHDQVPLAVAQLPTDVAPIEGVRNGQGRVALGDRDESVQRVHVGRSFAADASIVK